MEIWVLCGFFALSTVILTGYLLLLRHSIREVAEGLEEKLQTDTNTLISISSGDKAVRTLAAQINRQLLALQAERRTLQQGDWELKQAVTNVSHDLRTPLTAICGYLDLLEQEPQSEATGRYLAILRDRTNAMRTLTEELLRYSVITATAEDLTPEPLNVTDILEQSLAGLYGALSGRGIVPQIELPQEPIVRRLDKTALRRVFDNILSNVAKYSRGDLTVVLSPQGEILFENSAEGLDAVQTAHLFDRFFTVNGASGGTGLGLSIAKLLTEKMGGSISAEYHRGKLQVRVRFPE